MTRCGGQVGDKSSFWDVLPVVLVLEKRNMCMYVLNVCVCVFQSISSARFPLCQSVVATEHPGFAQPSIICLPWWGFQKHTHTCAHMHTITLLSSYAPLTTFRCQRKPRPPATLLKGYSCCIRGH